MVLYRMGSGLLEEIGQEELMIEEIAAVLVHSYSMVL